MWQRIHNFALSYSSDMLQSTNGYSNTGQVLTSLGQALVTDNIRLDEAASLLQEAMEMFQRCLTLQIAQKENQPANQPPEAGSSGESSAPQPESTPVEEDSNMVQEEEEIWASISEPITNDTLVDTMLAQLEASTSLCSLITIQTMHILDWLGTYSRELVDTKLPIYLEGTGRDAEARLAGINFVCAFSDAYFRCGRYTAQEYEEWIRNAFGSYENINNEPRALCDRAEAWITFNASLRRHSDQSHHLAARWNALSVAVQSLTAATKLPDAENLAGMHLLRGDVELSRYQLGQPPLNYPAAASNSAILLKNAATYYRGAQREADNSSLPQESMEARVKGAVAQGFGGDASAIKHLMQAESSATQLILEQCLDEGLVTMDDLRGGHLGVA